MTRSQQTTRNISNALRSIDRSLVPEDCDTEVYWDSVGRCWYAQFVTTETIGQHAGHQRGLLGQGLTPLSAVQCLMALNKPESRKNIHQLKESSHD